MAVPTWTTGEVLAASDVNTWFVPLAAIKLSDQSVTSSTVLVNDTALLLPLAINRSYEITLELFWLPVNNSVTPGLDINFTFPASTTLSLAVVTQGSILGISQASPSVNGIGAAASGGYSVTSIHGYAATSSTAGNLQLQWCQSTSSATSTTIKASSFITARAIG